MQNILGLDLGTNSIGWAIRDSSLEETQFEKYGVNVFKKGVGEGKTGEFSLAAERTKKRSIRRLYQARKYRLWETLRVLIENDYCPLTMDDLDSWRKYDKEKGYLRKYPNYAKDFESWIRLDFNKDGIADYTSPYQLRKELAEIKIEISIRNERYKIGRAIYHIAQRRGFKSSKKDIQLNDETGEKKDANSESEKAKAFNDKLNKQFGKTMNDFSTIGCALAFIEKQGERVRNEWIQYTFRRNYKEELAYILEKQGFSKNDLFYKSLVETKSNRYDGAVFYQRPLRSQKGLVGKCTLETSKPRCPISHPVFEEFRAWTFLNNIKYKTNIEDNWKQIPLELRKEIFHIKYLNKAELYFPFKDIRSIIEKKYRGCILNYKDNVTVAGCPVSARLKSIFGGELKNYQYVSSYIRENKRKDGSTNFYTIKYDIEDIWHVLFSFNDEEFVDDFAKSKLNLNDEQIKIFVTAWNQLPEGYAMLSLNALKKILPFLHKGYIYTEAVLLANLPTVLGKDIWNKNEVIITNLVIGLIKKNREEKQLLSIVNELISKWHISDYKTGYKNSNYVLDERDKRIISSTIKKALGEKSWTQMALTEKENITKKATHLFQCFFKLDLDWKYIKDEKYYVINFDDNVYYKSFGSGYYKVPHLLDYIKTKLQTEFNLKDSRLDKLYHPSQIDIYPKAKPNKDGKIFLQSPKTGSFKNPMAMRTLYELRKLVNYLIAVNAIDEDTEVIVELSRDLNDANKRWAIETYQKRREEENKEFAIAISELLNDPEIFGIVRANPANKDDIDKFRLWYEQIEHENSFKYIPAKNKINKDGKEILNNDRRKHDWNNIRSKVIKKVIEERDLVKKYRLWKEQFCRCMYTGKLINITDLFNENVIDFEHTIPRSISFDNSLANLTVCYADYNRNTKKNRIPTSLENYDEDWGGFTSIKPRLEPWEKRIEELQCNIDFWKKKSRFAKDKSSKDAAIRQKHLWQFEFDYWINKLERFKMQEVKTGFKNSQLIDTQLISKYAFHYLKSVFNVVKVQKGSITSEFRKIYGVQPKDEIKNRDNHSHHAIDAAVLTLIPASAKREEILEKSYKHDEQWTTGTQNSRKEKQFHLKPYPRFRVEHLKEIEENILINNVSRDKALVPAKRILKKRGRKVYQTRKDGQLKLDENGKKKHIIITGDCVRGELHKETFLGAIKKHVRDENGNPIVGKDGKFLLEKDIAFVVREPLVYKKDAASPGFKTLEEIKKNIVDPYVYKIIEKQVGDKSLKTAIEEGIWMLNKKGEKINRIRHIRIFVREKEPLQIKKQTYLSKYDYKQFYYATNATNLLYALYQSIDGKRKFRHLNLFEVTQIKSGVALSNVNEFFEKSFFVGKKEYSLLYILNAGLKVIFYRSFKEELKELSKSELIKRLYFIKKLFDFKTGTIQFQYHLDSRNDKELEEAFSPNVYGQKGKNGFSKIDLDNPFPRLLLSPISFNFIVENKDFKVKQDGGVQFLF